MFPGLLTGVFATEGLHGRHHCPADDMDIAGIAGWMSSNQCSTARSVPRRSTLPRSGVGLRVSSVTPLV